MDMNGEEPPPLDVVTAQYLEHCSARFAESTTRNRQVTLLGFGEWLESSSLAWYEVNEQVVEAYIDFLLNDGYADRSVESKLYNISSFYGWATERGVVPFNPVEPVDMGHLSGNEIDKHEPVRYITNEEYKQLVNTEMPIRDEVAIRLLYNCGLRCTEAVGVRLEDVDVDERKVEVKTAKGSDGKSRTVYFTRRCARCFRDYMDGGGRSAHLGAAESPYLLVSAGNNKMASQRLSKLVRSAAKRAGIQSVAYVDQSGTKRHKVTPHCLRHSYAVERVKAGMSIVYLKRLLGHNSVETTKQYLKFRKSDVKEQERKYAP